MTGVVAPSDVLTTTYNSMHDVATTIVGNGRSDARCWETQQIPYRTSRLRFLIVQIPT